MSAPLRYGIIGSGMMGQEHIRNIDAVDGCTVIAVSDPDDSMRRQAAGISNANSYSDHREMLQREPLDALVIAAPNHTHRAILDDVLKTDLPVLVEKPMCTTLADVRHIEGRCAQRTAPVWVAMEYRYMPPVAKLIEEVRAGVVGRLWMLSIREHRFPFLRKVGNWNRFAAKSGGTMVEKCCHFFDLMRLIVQSEPVRIYGSGANNVNHLDETYPDGQPDVLDNAYVVVDFANGARACLDLCMFAEAGRDQEEITAIGDAGKVECSLPSSTYVRGRRGHRERMGDRLPIERETIEVDPALLALGDHHGSTFYQHQAFADMIRQGGTPAVTVRDGSLAVRMGIAAEESIRCGQPVHLSGQVDSGAN